MSVPISQFILPHIPRSFRTNPALIRRWSLIPLPMPFGFCFWGHSCHLAFDFWASLCFLFHLECDSWLVKFWFSLVWVHRHLVQTVRANMWIAHSKFPHPPPPETPWEKFLNSHLLLWSNDKKNGLKILDLYWHRIGKWTEVSLSPGLLPVINSQGLIKLRPLLPQKDNPCWDQSALVIRAKLSTIWSKFWV